MRSKKNIVGASPPPISHPPPPHPSGIFFPEEAFEGNKKKNNLRIIRLKKNKKSTYPLVPRILLRSEPI